MNRITFLALLFSVLACSPDPRDVSGWAGQILSEPVPRPDFTLLDTEGRAFDFRAETEGKVTLLFIGYTYCPDVCPVHFANLAAVLKRQPYEVKSNVQVVFITADPSRDTPERVDEWLNAVHPDFIGLRGSVAEVHTIEDALGVPRSSLGDADENGDYMVAHAAQIFAFGSDGPARVVYPFGTRQADWVLDLSKLVRGETPTGG